MLSGSRSQEKIPYELMSLVKQHQGPIYSIKFNSDGEYCMSGSEDRSVCLYNPQKNIMIKQYKNIHNYDVYSLDISKDNSKFITAGGDKNIILTDVIEGKYIRKYTGHTARVNSVCFNPENNVIISGSYDTTVKLWDNRSNSYHPIDVLRQFKDSVSQVQVHQQYQIACGSIDGSIKFFDIRKGQVIQDYIKEPAQRFAIANSGKAYAISATNDHIYLVEKSTGKKIQQYTGHSVKQFTVDLLFNWKDSHIITGAQDGKLYVYDIMKKQPIRVIQAHSKVISALSIHQKGAMVSASHDGTIAFWKL